ncbi:Acg family FMN-binding oxidoreductase [Streptomyces sp. NPDC018693]|uniref:Acg family FMN-binding oxidoreductase n=1 Tax=unclassified Streptomyces TaxID=2593676 RepID=UPI0037964D4B
MTETAEHPAIGGSHPPADHAAHYLVRAAVTAPSACNTQPWRFVARDGELHLHADPSRGLPASDPDGREMLISCGAALFNVRLAMRHLGFLPRVALFPDPARPWHLATVHWGPYAPPTSDEERLFAALPHRHTHRGPFRPEPLSARLVEQLRRHAGAEGAGLYTVSGREDLRHLALLIRDAERTRRTHPGCARELAQWTPRSGSGRADGLPAHAYPRNPDTTAFSGRDYAARTRRGHTDEPAQRTLRPSLGLVVLLDTRHDQRTDWLRTGQGLQRMLLHAAAHDIAAAFHTQPLELPDLRRRVRRSVFGGGHPQVILRLGYVNTVRRTPRRPVRDVLTVPSGAHLPLAV